MWYVTTLGNKTKFFSSKKKAIEIDEIEWTNEVKTKEIEYFSSKPFIKNSQKATTALIEAGVTGYPTKLKAKEFAKTLPVGTWKYLQIN